MSRALLLLNLGTPESAQPRDVGNYLREFLMDPQVIDIPWLARWILVNFLIVPQRSRTSSVLYKKIWTSRGSPLLFHTRDLTEKVRKEIEPGWTVEMAMRYGNPGIGSALAKLKTQKVDEILVLPLYPQYSLAATQSSMDRVTYLLREMKWEPRLHFFKPFYDDPQFIKSFAESARQALDGKVRDFTIFSFHGLPERQIKKTEIRGGHCTFEQKCCFQMTDANRLCYRAQCYATASKIAAELGLTPNQYTVGFQSRLGRTPWIKPWSDEICRELAGKGVKRLAVISPSFVADCLETLEEIAIRGKEDFIRHGGEDLILVPSLNSRESWVKALAQWAADFFRRGFSPQPP